MVISAESKTDDSGLNVGLTSRDHQRHLKALTNLNEQFQAIRVFEPEVENAQIDRT